MEPEIGQQILHYRVIRKLGQGGMGSVFMAEDTKLNRKVALKFLPAEMLADPERLKRFEREAQTVASLNHPNIVTIYSVEESQGVPFIAMELVEGQVLGELIPNEGQTLERFFELAIPIADAVSAAHERGITHRDLKPGNIMVGTDGRVKILDFGLAKLLENADTGDTTSLATQTLTKTGSAMGTVTYMAPEQLKGKAPDQRADIFSLGVVFYQMASGKRPFSGETSAEVISSILRDNPAPVTEHKLEIPSHMGRIVKRCLEKNPARRYQTAAELRAELLELQREIETGAVFEDDARTRAITIERRSRRSLFVMSAAAAIAVILMLGLFFSGKSFLSPTPGSRSPAPAPQPTIAVLPFSSVGESADRTFSDGLNEEVTSLMTALPGVQVVSRATASQALPAAASTREIGSTLAAEYLVLGTVRWAADDQQEATVRANLQLIRVEDDIQIWSDSYDRQLGDTLSVQTEIARDVVRAIGVGAFGLSNDALPDELLQGDASDESPRQARIEARAVRKPPPASPPTAETLDSEPQTSRVTRIEERPAVQDTSAEPAPPMADVEIELTSYAPAGVLTIYADGRQILSREFAFARQRRKGLLGRKKVAGTLSVPLEIPVETDSLRVYVLVDGESQMIRLAPSFEVGVGHRLSVVVNRKGELEAGLE